MTGIRNLQDSIRRRIIQQTTAAQVAQNAATVAGTASSTAEAAATTADATAKGVATAATVAQTAATVKLTAAQKIFNIVAAANPYVLLATVILGVGAALYGLISASHDATDQMKKEQEAAEKLKAAHEKRLNQLKSIGTASGNVAAEMMRLTAEYKNLKTEGEKTQWMEENKQRFHQLGFEVESLTDLENIFVKNTGAVVSALIARAVAAKKAELAAQKIVELQEELNQQDLQFDEGDNISKNGARYKVFTGKQELSDEEARAAGVRTKNERRRTDNSMTAMYQAQYTGGSRTYWDAYTEAEIKKVNEYRNRVGAARQRAVKATYDQQVKGIQKGVEEAVKAQYEADKKLYSLVKKPTLKTTTTKTPKTPKTEQESPLAGSLADLKKQREDLIKIQQNATYKKHKTNADEVAKEIARLDKAIADAQFDIDFNTDPAKVSLEAIEKKYDEVYAKARSQKLEGADLSQAGTNLSLLNQADVNRRYTIGLDIKPAEDSLIALQKKADEVFAKLQNPEVSGSADFSAMRAEYDALVEQINKKKIELGIDTKPAEDSVDDLQARIIDLLGQQNAIKLEVQTDDTKARIEELQAKIDELKQKMDGQSTVLTINTTPAHASMKAIEDRIAALKKRLKEDVTLDIDGQKDIVSEIRRAEADLKQHKITIGLETDPSAEQLKTLAKQTEDMLKPKKQSSFKMAVGVEKPEGLEEQLRLIEQTMNSNDQLIAKLEEQKAKYEELGQTGSEAYQKIIDKIKSLNEENQKMGGDAKKTKQAADNAKKTSKNWEYATDAVGNFGSALSSIGDATDSPELNVAGVIAQTLANLAMGASQAISQASTLGPFGWIAFSVLAMAQLASMVAQVSSITSHAGGGFIPGNSYSGDKRLARVNSGELVLNSNQ